MHSLITSAFHSLNPQRIIYILNCLLCLGLFACEPTPSSTTIQTSDLGQTGGPLPVEFDASYLDAFMDMLIIDDPCDPNPCSTGSTCEVIDAMQGEYQCTLVTCADNPCPSDARCEDSAEGALCTMVGCQGTEDCESNEFCDAQGQCQADVCQANERQCQGAQILICNSDGSELIPWLNCPFGATQCLDTPLGAASCACLDDWECPEHMRCEQGRCSGRPEEAICLLEPVDFSASLPAPEITWGGTAESPLANGHPLPSSSQAVMTPLVANLDDDNGDGLIDEGDIPEIIFMTFCNRDFTSNGALRAIHGGGLHKGQDLFVSVGEQHWFEGDDLATFNPNCDQAILDSTAGIAVANLDAMGSMYPEPEIVGIHEDEGIVIHNHRGEVIAQGFIGLSGGVGGNPTPSIAQLDGKGMAEIIVSRVVFTVARVAGEIVVLDYFQGLGSAGRNTQGGVSCVADILGDSRPEIIAGGTVYRYPRAPQGAIKTADCVENGGMITPQNEEETAWCNGRLEIVWQQENLDGFCAIADIWGADVAQAPGPNNPLDGQAEVILISNSKLIILDSQTGTIIHEATYGSGNDKGGAPNVGDFDGDGFPEVGSAFAAGYVMMDLQAPSPACPTWDVSTADEESNGVFGRPERSPGDQCMADSDCAEGAWCVSGACVCGHQGWRRQTEDDSSKVTGSTLFDFNGDGAMEVIYNDECFFRIYDGSTGLTLFKQPSESRTRIEHPIVADVDADGNAEIIFSTSTESGFCSVRNQNNALGQTYSSLYNPGLEVWGDPEDRWVSARKIWNQHAYHVTNISESGVVPLQEPKSWLSTFGRSYNTYRAQPSSFGLAPDLRIENLRASASRNSCGQTEQANSIPLLNLSVTVNNNGEVQVGAGILVSLLAQWRENGEFTPLKNANGEDLILTTNTPLLAGVSVSLSTVYNAEQDPSAPHISSGLEAPLAVKAIIDPPLNNSFGRERECDENNNEAQTTPNLSEQIPDLVLTLNSFEIDICPELRMNLSIENLGEVNVSNVELGLYLGDPRQGGTRIDTYRIEDEISAGERRQIDWVSQQFPEYRSAQIFIIADPANQIIECDDDNNVVNSEAPVSCQERDGK